MIFLRIALQSFDGSLGGVFHVLPMILALCSCYLRFRVRYCAVGSCWSVFHVLSSALTFLLYPLYLRRVKFAPSHSWGWRNPFVLQYSCAPVTCDVPVTCVFCEGQVGLVLVILCWTLRQLFCLEGRSVSQLRIKRWACSACKKTILILDLVFPRSERIFLRVCTTGLHRLLSITARDRRYPMSTVLISDPHIDSLHT